MKKNIKEILKVPGTIMKVMTMADKGVRLEIDTQEITPVDAATIMLMKGNLGWFVFCERGIVEENIKDLPKIQLEEGEKSPSARLRAVLFVFWEQRKIQESFDIFYRRQMEKLIDEIKQKLN